MKDATSITLIPVDPNGTSRGFGCKIEESGESSSMIVESPTYPRTFMGELLRNLRVCQKMNLRDAGEALGLSVVQMSELERGRYTLGADDWCRAAAAIHPGTMPWLTPELAEYLETSRDIPGWPDELHALLEAATTESELTAEQVKALDVLFRQKHEIIRPKPDLSLLQRMVLRGDGSRASRMFVEGSVPELRIVMPPAGAPDDGVHDDVAFAAWSAARALWRRKNKALYEGSFDQPSDSTANEPVDVYVGPDDSRVQIFTIHQMAKDQLHESFRIPIVRPPSEVLNYAVAEEQLKWLRSAQSKIDTLTPTGLVAPNNQVVDGHPSLRPHPDAEHWIAAYELTKQGKLDEVSDLLLKNIDPIRQPPPSPVVSFVVMELMNHGKLDSWIEKFTADAAPSIEDHPPEPLCACTPGAPLGPLCARAAGRKHGGAPTCPRPCSECKDGAHHFTDIGTNSSMDDEEIFGEHYDPEYVAEMRANQSHPAAQAGCRVWHECYHCGAWMEFDADTEPPALCSCLADGRAVGPLCHTARLERGDGLPLKHGGPLCSHELLDVDIKVVREDWDRENFDERVEQLRVRKHPAALAGCQSWYECFVSNCKGWIDAEQNDRSSECAEGCLVEDLDPVSGGEWHCGKCGRYWEEHIIRDLDARGVARVPRTRGTRQLPTMPPPEHHANDGCSAAGFATTKLDEQLVEHFREDGTLWAYELAKAILDRALGLKLLECAGPDEVILWWYYVIAGWTPEAIAEAKAWVVAASGNDPKVPQAVMALVEQEQMLNAGDLFAAESRWTDCGNSAERKGPFNG